VFFNAFDEGRGHIATYLLNEGRIAMVLFEIGLEPLQSRGVLPLGGAQYLRRFQIHK